MGNIQTPYFVESWATESGCISAGHVAWYMDSVGFVLAFVAAGRGRLTWMLGKSGIYVMWLKLVLLGSQRAIPQVLNLSGGVKFIVWWPEVLLLRRIPTWPKTFWGMLGVSRIWPSIWTHLKTGLVLHSYIRWSAWQILGWHFFCIF